MTIVLIIIVYWLIPRTMDEALTLPYVEVFKFISWPFLVGVPLRDSWGKLNTFGQGFIFISISIIFSGMAWLYIASPNQLCRSEERRVGKECRSRWWTRCVDRREIEVAQ